MTKTLSDYLRAYRQAVEGLKAKQAGSIDAAVAADAANEAALAIARHLDELAEGLDDLRPIEGRIRFEAAVARRGMAAEAVRNAAREPVAADPAKIWPLLEAGVPFEVMDHAPLMAPETKVMPGGHLCMLLYLSGKGPVAYHSPDMGRTWALLDQQVAQAWSDRRLDWRALWRRFNAQGGGE